MGKTQSKKMRESGFELVRIIAMVLIVANHLMNHGIFKVTSQTPYSLFPQMSPLNQAVSAVISCPKEDTERLKSAVSDMTSGKAVLLDESTTLGRYLV